MIATERGPGVEGLYGGGGGEYQDVARGDCGDEEGRDPFGEEECGSFEHQLNLGKEIQ